MPSSRNVAVWLALLTAIEPICRNSSRLTSNTSADEVVEVALVYPPVNST